MSTVASAFNRIVAAARNTNVDPDDWSVMVRARGMPRAARLRDITLELGSRGIAWICFQATNRITGAFVETIACADLAWQCRAQTDVVESGGWDDAREVLWLSGGRQVDVRGRRVEALSVVRSGIGNERRHQRVPIAVPVSFGGGRMAGEAVDVSLGGAFVRTEATLRVSQRLILAFKPHRQKGFFLLTGEVVRSHPGRAFAVKFIQPLAQERERVRRVVRVLVAS